MNSPLGRSPFALGLACLLSLIAAAPLAAQQSPELPKDEFKKLLAESLPPPVDPSKEVLIVPLRGNFEFYFDDSTPVIQPDIFECVLAVAQSRKPAVIVLEIDSNGGLVAVMDQIIEQIVVAQRDQRTRIVAWSVNAYSAAALTSLACRELIVHPGCVVGAATLVIGENEVKERTAMDSKIASVRDAKRRAMAALTGRPMLLFDAMQFPQARLWFHPQRGFSSSPPADDASAWITLDADEKRPMSLNASELVASGIAKCVASGDRELLSALQVPTDATVIRINPWSEAAKPKLSVVLKRLSTYWRNAVARLDRVVWKRLLQSCDSLQLMSRAVEAQAAKPGWTPSDKKELAKKLADCRKALPKLDKQTREILQRLALLECVEGNITAAAGQLDLAIKTIDVDRQMLPVGAILQDVVDAWGYLVAALQGCEEAEPVSQDEGTPKEPKPE